MLAPVERGKGGGGPTEDQRKKWKAWRRARKGFEHDPAQDPNGGGIADITYPHLGKRLDQHVEPPPSAVERLGQRSGANLLGTWRQDPTPTHPFGVEKGKGVAGRRTANPTESPARRSQGILAEHSRHHFRTYNDKKRMVGTLPLHERLFMFYKRLDRRMVARIPEIASYWRDDEKTLNNVLKYKYKSNLDEEGLGTDCELLINVDVLKTEMEALNAKMSPNVIPEPTWIPQHSNNLAPIALRDAIILSNAEVHLPITELDAEIRASFSAAEASATRPIPFPSPASANTSIDSMDSSAGRDSAQKFRLSLSLKEHVIGFRRISGWGDDSSQGSATHQNPQADSVDPEASSRRSTAQTERSMATTLAGGGEASRLPTPQVSTPLFEENRSDLAECSLPVQMQSAGQGDTNHREKDPHASADLQDGIGILASGGDNVDNVFGGLQQAWRREAGSRPATADAVRQSSDEVGTGARRRLLAPLSPLREDVERSDTRPYTAPDEVATRMLSLSCSRANDRQNWQEHQSQAYAMPYWYNRETGESRWHPPVDMGHQTNVDDTRFQIRQQVSSMNRKQKGNSVTAIDRVSSDEPDGLEKLQRGASQIKMVNAVSAGVSSTTSSRPVSRESDGEISRKPSLRRAGSLVMAANAFSVQNVQDHTQFTRVSSRGIERMSSLARSSNSSGVKILSIDDDGSGTDSDSVMTREVKFDSSIESEAQASGEQKERKKVVYVKRGMRIGHATDSDENAWQERMATLMNVGKGGSQGVGVERPSLTREQKIIQRMQAWARGYLARKDVKMRKMASVEWGKQALAKKIQQWWRRCLHVAEMRRQRKAMKGAVSSGLFGPIKVRMLAKGWLRKTRARMQREKEEKCAVVIQKHFRGMQGIKRVRKKKAQLLVDACVAVQRAWRKKLEWANFVKQEERKAMREAARLKQQYLYGGKTAKQQQEIRAHALDDFEENTSDLGRTKVADQIAAEAGKSVQAMDPFNTWMITLKALMQREKGEEAEQIATKRPGGMSNVMAYTKNSNPEHVYNAIMEQRVVGPLGMSAKLVLIDMKPKMLRWPFGISDNQMGKAPWFELQTVYLSKNKLRGLPLDFFKLTNLTDLRLDNNLMTTVPATFGSLCKLHILWLHNNQIETIPVEISQLRDLSFLSLNDNNIKSLPFELCTLTNLMKMPLSNNLAIMSPPIELAKVADTKEGCIQVQKFFRNFWNGLSEPFLLDLSGFDMVNIPSIDRVKSVKTMNLSRNQLKRIDHALMWDSKFNVAWHNNLTVLDLSCNSLKRFPDVITRLVTLCDIDISRNNISVLPAEISFLTRLISFKADACPLSSPTHAVVDDGVESYVIFGSVEYESAMGTYRKSPVWLNGRPVFELRRRDSVWFLFADVNSGSQCWCVGPDTKACNAFLRVHDGALLVSQARSTWKEKRTAQDTRQGNADLVGARMHRNHAIKVRGVGMREYFSRVLQYRAVKNEAVKLKDFIRANEEVAEHGGASEEEKRAQREQNRQKFKEVTQRLVLDCNNLSLEKFPENICDAGVRDVVLDNNLIEKIPAHVYALPLVRISLDNNRIESLDAEIGSLNMLEYLSLNGNSLSMLPDSMSKLRALRTLKFAKNNFSALPEVIGHLQALQQLDFTRNMVSSIPMSLTGLESLGTLKSAGNQLSHIGSKFMDQVADMGECCLAHLRTITSLDLSGNTLTTIPESMRTLTMLKELVLAGNRFADLSPLQTTIACWCSLNRLDASGNRLYALPDDMRALEYLEHLDLSTNMFEMLPPGACSCPALKTLDMHTNFVEKLSANVGNLSALTSLDMSENSLLYVAPELGLLSKLQSLNLSRNHLRWLPPIPGMTAEVLGLLCNLQTLDVSNNQLEYLPLDIRNCSSLCDLHVFGNPLKHPALIRAQSPCLGTIKLTVDEVSKITYYNKMNQKARTHGNPMCTVGLEGRSSSGAEQVQETSCKVETNAAFFKQDFTLVIRDCTKDVSVRLHTKPLNMQTRMIDMSAAYTPLRGLNLSFPVLLPVLYQQPIFNFFQPQALKQCVENCSLLYYTTDEDVVCMGDKCSALFLVLFGRIRLFRTAVDGPESVSQDLKAGEVMGEESLLYNDAFSVTASALEPTVLVKVPLTSMSAVLKNDPLKSAHCVLYHEALQYRKGDIERAAKEKEIVWGSRQWDKLRAEENNFVLKRMETVCQLHVFSMQATFGARQHLEKRADALNSSGKVIFDAAKTASDVDLDFIFEFDEPMPEGVSEESQREKKEAGVLKEVEKAQASLRAEFECSDRVKSYFLAFNDIANASEPDPYAMAVLRRHSSGVHSQHVRATPDGIMFDTEVDWLRDNAEAQRIEDYMRALNHHKRLTRCAPVWEKMPLMFFVDGVFDREWDRAADSRAEYSSGTFREMGPLVERIKADPRLADLTPTTPHRNQRISTFVERYVESHYTRQSIPEEGAAFQFYKECPSPKIVGTRSDPLSCWSILTGLLLVKPQALLQRESAHRELVFQDQQLAAISDMQEHASLKSHVKTLKGQLSEMLNEIEIQRRIIKDQFVVLRDGYDGDAVAAIKAARKSIDHLEARFQMVSQNRDRAKALYKLRERSSTSLRWKGLPALNAVFEAISQFTDPNVDEVGAEANARGGPLDADLLRQVTVADSVHPVDLIEVKDVVEWVAADSYLCRSEANCLAIQAAMQEHQINGRMLMHVLKSDLMRMGLQGPVARLLLIRIESFKAERKIGKPEPSVEKQHGTSAEFALLAPEERKYFLKNFFELDERQVSSFCRVFEKFDADKQGEINVGDLAEAVAACGATLHSQNLKAFKKRYDPDESGTIDIICFLHIVKGALMGA